MLTKLKSQFSTTGLVLSTAAIVLSFTGAALAASGGLTAKQKNEVKAIAKGFQGIGPEGKPGLEGKLGLEGKPGTPGAGSGGNSVVLGSASGCLEGGISVEVEGTPSTKREVCNGTEGAQGPRGKPGEPGEPGSAGQTGFTETLPTGATETGTWISPPIENASEALDQVSISFSIPLASPLSEASYVSTEEQNSENGKSPPPACTGNVEAPTAQKGNLCVYQGRTENPTESTKFTVSSFRRSGSPEYGAGTTGAVLYVSYQGEASSEPTRMSGTWAATAP